MKGKILAVCISEKKGTSKKDIKEIDVIENFGLKGDAHGGDWHRQVSLLSFEKIVEFRKRGGKVGFGDFGENIVVEGIDFSKIELGMRLSNDEIILEITQIGKTCHSKCNIFYSVGECIMPRNGIFARVLKGGYIKVGDYLEIEN
ncbi:molybdenum cofactor sulfurase [Clostridium polyendosporum]|uniref:Molybdenum cofactor sulfurase n=1 Tax=Clostridium polyendosporum TaxID=69208 RepID=A0A919S0S0_9CLOT|nr:MOSC domain-containing protein [Clostridium polyendosporum]GIM29707.1 molybdenum cofactor sulfurase [Clostridium polyendosporum]